MSAFVLASSHVGPLIVNVRDRGVGYQVLSTGTHEPEVIDIGCRILNEKRQLRGDGVHAVDVGANIGTCTMGWANHMAGWGRVTAYEPQERVYYALAGGVALNNAGNARAVHAIVTDYEGSMKIPVLDHDAPANFGGLSMLVGIQVEPGQPVSFDEKDMAEVRATKLDKLTDRVDFIKIDVEGMEAFVLEGAREMIEREKPVIAAEYLHCPHQRIREKLPGYDFILINYNIYCVHPSDRPIYDMLQKLITP